MADLCGYILCKMQYLKEAGWADSGRVIACTQPRRLAVQVIKMLHSPLLQKLALSYLVCFLLHSKY